jgi:pimeloyl-ACP methyl ester carboxylesterase
MHVIQGEQAKNVVTREYRVETSHGSLAAEEIGHGEIPLVMIRGNSYSRGVFRHQLHSSLSANHRLIAFDLPGHGESSNAPERSRAKADMRDINTVKSGLSAAPVDREHVRSRKVTAANVSQHSSRSSLLCTVSMPPPHRSSWS